MKRVLVVLAAGLILSSWACRQGDDIWFDGDFTAATSLAKQRNSLVMLAFTTSWCSWCERMERETFSAPEVAEALADVVAVKLDAERGGRRLAARYGVDSYPTIVFTNGDGDEVDRILGYLPPGEFVAQTAKIRAGDTFFACLHRLSEDPADVDAIARAVGGLLERSDAEGAITRIKSFHRATDGHEHALCTELMFEARIALHDRLYGRAAKLFLKSWEASFSAPDTDGSRHLHRLIEDGLATVEPDAQAALLRQARYDDASDLLGLVDIETLTPSGLRTVADFAFRTGHYDVAERSYIEWVDTLGDAADPDDLNSAAWHLYLTGRSLDEAVEMARRAYDNGPDGDVADTLARLLYVTGDVDGALRLQKLAVERAGPLTAANYSDALKRMEAGQQLPDRPAFELYPGGSTEPTGPTSSSPL